MGVPRTLRTALAALAMLVPLTVPALHGSASAAGYGQIVGTATYDPGLPATGCAYQTVTFDGLATLVDEEQQTVAEPVSMVGNSTTCESLASGSGLMTVSGAITGTFAYNRTGDLITMSAVQTQIKFMGWACAGFWAGGQYLWICTWVPDVVQ